MRLGIRGKLFLVSVGLILVALFLGGLYLESQLRQVQERHIESELLRYARVVRETIQTTPAVMPIETGDKLADRLGAALSARVTLIASSGTVFGDSQIPTDRVGDMENHGRRPEVLAAQRNGRGASRRFSTTLGTDMLYTAVPFQRDDLHGVVRVAMPLDEVDRSVSTLRLLLLIAGGLALGLAVLMSALASHLYSRPLRRLVASTRAVAEGKSEQHIPVPSGDEIGGLIGSFNRVSKELKTVVSTLAEERNRFEAVLEAMDDGVLALDRQGSISHCNAAALSLLGLRESPLGRSLLETIRVPVLHQALKQAGTTESSSVEFDLPREKPRRLQASITAQRGGGGKVVVLHDVTELRHLETVRQDFVANVSHELRTPVSIIRANTETLLNGALEEPAQARDFLEALQRNSERLSNLIADLLDISRIDSGQYQLDLRPVSVSAVVRQTLEALEFPARRKRLQLENDVGEEKVLADGKALHQVVLNLVDNAVKYTPEKGSLRIRTSRQNDLVRIEVADDGPGIEPRHRERIFERFYRIDAGRSREMGGTGLGLSIAKNLVERMGGQIGVEPNDLQGSVFWISLPPGISDERS